MTLDIGWFSTGRDQAACDLLDAVMREINSKTLDCRISYVFCNRAPGESGPSDAFHQLVRGYGLPLLYFSSSAFEPELRRHGRSDPEALQSWRRAYDQRISAVIGPYSAGLLLLAGYMLVVSEEFCTGHDLLNLHPALPGGPSGSWQEVIWRLILEEADQAGAMMHLVTPELDRGPAVSYFSFSLRGPRWDGLWRAWDLRKKSQTAPAWDEANARKTPGPEEELFWAIRNQEARRELPLLTLTLDLLARGEVRVCGGRPLDRAGMVLSGGYCLNEAVEERLKRWESLGLA